MTYGRYEIIKEVGRGSMGVVYQARDPHIDRLIAVKVMRQDRMTNETFVKRFMKEARVIGRLSHPRIVTIFDVGEERDEIYIAMEFLEGVSLADFSKERRLTPAEIVEFGIQIAETLDYAHRKGVVHRDIKPSNIIVEPDGQTKITDFGIARIEDPSATLQTQAGEIMGTPAYMSPEQVLGNQVDGRSDIFSLGVILYELSTGGRPFGGDGKTLATVFNDIITLTPQEPHAASVSTPQALSGIVMKALSKEPAQRFQTGKELAEALRGCLGKQEPVSVAAPAVPLPKKKQSPAVPIVIGVLLLFVFGGAAAYYLYRGEQIPSSNQTPQAKVIPTKTVQVPPPLPQATAQNPPSVEQGQQDLDAEKPLTEKLPQPRQQEAKQPKKVPTEVRPPKPAISKSAPKPASLTVRTTPPGAFIQIDGKSKGKSPLTLSLPKGSHLVRAYLTGYEKIEKQVVLEEGARYPLTLNLKTIANSDEWVVKPLVDRPRE